VPVRHIGFRFFVIIKASNYVYGVDFGTSNSAIAIWDQNTGRVISDDRVNRSAPSLLYFPYARSFGSDARRNYLGTTAIERYLTDGMDGRLFQAIKTILPDKTFNQTIVNNISYNLEDLIAIILRNLKESADAVVGGNVGRAVIGRPAVFHRDPEREQVAIERLEKAASIAGFREIHFQFEPIAAAFAYETGIDEPKTVLVGDFGGGTSDFTLIRLDPEKTRDGDRSGDILATGGVSVAANTLDSEVMWHRLTPAFGRGARYWEYPGDPKFRVPSSEHHQICQWDQIVFLNEPRVLDRLRRFAVKSDRPEAFQKMITLIKENRGFALFQEIERAKVELSRSDHATIRFEPSGISICEDLTIEDFEHYTLEHIETIEGCVDNLLASVEDGAASVNSVFLTGGTSLVRAVRDVFTRRFGSEKVHTGATFTSVVDGLARSAPLFFTN